MTHHPTWAEVYTEWLKDPVFVKALELYAPVARDHAAERRVLQQRLAEQQKQ